MLARVLLSDMLFLYALGLSVLGFKVLSDHLYHLEAKRLQSELRRFMIYCVRLLSLGAFGISFGVAGLHQLQIREQLGQSDVYLASRVVFEFLLD